MEDREIEELCRRWGEAAAFLEASGIDGVEVHGAHGCKCKP
jgi:2,4-dienoyl-CoA reductase-like NADH-dependent reductase (Old Yellow Enzyme family)